MNLENLVLLYIYTDIFILITSEKTGKTSALKTREYFIRNPSKKKTVSGILASSDK